MNSSLIGIVLIGNIEALDQGIELVQQLSDKQYTYVPDPVVSSHIGQHFRHLVDLFVSVVDGIESKSIDYDIRRRGAQIETSRAMCMTELRRIKTVMESLQSKLSEQDFLVNSIQVKTEVTLKDTHSVWLQSSLLRELVFASSHAVHHFAIINIVAKLQGVNTSGSLGIAPATASFLREQEAVLS